MPATQIGLRDPLEVYITFEPLVPATQIGPWDVLEVYIITTPLVPATQIGPRDPMEVSGAVLPLCPPRSVRTPVAGTRECTPEVPKSNLCGRHKGM